MSLVQAQVASDAEEDALDNTIDDMTADPSLVVSEPQMKNEFGIDSSTIGGAVLPVREGSGMGPCMGVLGPHGVTGAWVHEHMGLHSSTIGGAVLPVQKGSGMGPCMDVCMHVCQYRTETNMYK